VSETISIIEDDPLRSSEETARICHVMPQTMVMWRYQGRGPRYVKIGRSVFYRESAIRTWLKAQERDPVAKARCA
jgi:hypothetical protein